MIFLRNHGAICSCPSGHVGDPLTACRLDIDIYNLSIFKYLKYFILFKDNYK